MLVSYKHALQKNSMEVTRDKNKQMEIILNLEIILKIYRV